MTPEEKVDRLIQLFESHSNEDMDRLDRIADDLRAHGEVIARIDERTKAQKERLDRIEKKSAGIGAFAGIIGATLAFLCEFIISLIHK